METSGIAEGLDSARLQANAAKRSVGGHMITGGFESGPDSQ